VVVTRVVEGLTGDGRMLHFPNPCLHPVEQYSLVLPHFYNQYRLARYLIIKSMLTQK
jgi:hypothetical protein